MLLRLIDSIADFAHAPDWSLPKESEQFVDDFIRIALLRPLLEIHALCLVRLLSHVDILLLHRLQVGVSHARSHSFLSIALNFDDTRLFCRQDRLISSLPTLEIILHNKTVGDSSCDPQTFVVGIVVVDDVGFGENPQVRCVFSSRRLEHYIVMLHLSRFKAGHFALDLRPSTHFKCPQLRLILSNLLQLRCLVLQVRVARFGVGLLLRLPVLVPMDLSQHPLFS
mmetsp:Transcript_52092/g.161946  ORF Transcript_52092/g.161946 Transcript_52092/m.161946 type:complete len:225 (+) Transcript_52092:176-850(+)